MDPGQELGIEMWVVMLATDIYMKARFKAHEYSPGDAVEELTNALGEHGIKVRLK